MTQRNDNEAPKAMTTYEELRDQVSRMECGGDYNDIWKESIAAERVHEAMRLAEQYANQRVLEELQETVSVLNLSSFGGDALQAAPFLTKRIATIQATINSNGENRHE